MPIDPKKKWDVFVSYAHPDNLQVGPVDGWVTKFIESLRNLLVQATGSRDLTVWHDVAMKASEKFDLSIGDAIANSAVFLIVFSPSWRSSPYCAQELDWFSKDCGSSGTMAGNFSRIIAARRGDVPFNQWPPEIQQQHDAVAFNDPTQPLLPLAVTDPAFNRPLGALVDGIRTVLFEMKARREANTAADEIHNAAPAVTPDGVSALYLASSAGLTREREAILADLDQVRRETNARIRVEVNQPEGPGAALERSTLSLHLFSGDPDPAALAELVKALSLPLRYRPIVWLPKSVDVDSVDSKSQTKLLESLRDKGLPPNIPPGNTAEFFQSDLEELKSELHRRLAPKASPVRRTMRGRNKRRQLIYVSHKGHGETLPELEGQFDLAEYEIWGFDHASPNAADIHKDYLRNCDGFAVVYDLASLDWAETLTHQALMSSRLEERPRALAAIQLPPPPSRPFANRADSLVQIHWEPASRAKDVKDFLDVLGDPNA